MCKSDIVINTKEGNWSLKLPLNEIVISLWILKKIKEPRENVREILSLS